MSDPVIRIDLPSGGWWEISTRPLWRHVRKWAADGEGQFDDADLFERALASLTTAWSFGEEVSVEALAQRDEDDLMVALEAFQREVMPNLESDSPRETAEELFAGMVSGQVPPRFAEVSVMAATGWSWQALQETPADVVQKMAIYLAVKQTRDGNGALDFPQTKDPHDAQ